MKGSAAAAKSDLVGPRLEVEAKNFNSVQLNDVLNERLAWCGAKRYDNTRPASAFRLGAEISCFC
jgi:hypothetical protein